MNYILVAYNMRMMEYIRTFNKYIRMEQSWLRVMFFLLKMRIFAFRVYHWDLWKNASFNRAVVLPFESGICHEVQLSYQISHWNNERWIALYLQFKWIRIQMNTMRMRYGQFWFRSKTFDRWLLHWFLAFVTNISMSNEWVSSVNRFIYLSKSSITSSYDFPFVSGIKMNPKMALHRLVTAKNVIQPNSPMWIFNNG